MESKYETDHKSPLWIKSENLLVPKEEPVDSTAFVKTENSEDDNFVVAGIVESIKDEISVKEEVMEPENFSESFQSSQIVS